MTDSEGYIRTGIAYGAPQWSEKRQAKVHIVDLESMRKIGNLARFDALCGVDIDNSRRTPDKIESVTCIKCQREQKKRDKVVSPN